MRGRRVRQDRHVLQNNRSRPVEMSRIRLDTSAYSALFRKHHATVQLVESAESLYLTLLSWES